MMDALEAGAEDMQASDDVFEIYTDPDASLTSPYTWNLDDTEGNPVADGVYNAIFYFNSGRHYGATPPLRIFVGRGPIRRADVSPTNSHG